jgi:hypothetical protein
LYPCQTVIGKKEHCIGNIKTGLNKENYNEIWDIEKSIDNCKECVLLPQCLGACPNERYISGTKCRKVVLINNIKKTGTTKSWKNYIKTNH